MEVAKAMEDEPKPMNDELKSMEEPKIREELNIREAPKQMEEGSKPLKKPKIREEPKPIEEPKPKEEPPKPDAPRLTELTPEVRIKLNFFCRPYRTHFCSDK